MIEYIYIPIVLFLYWRTWKYKTLIDDPVPRSGYLYVTTTEKCDPKLYEQRRKVMATITNVGVFLACCEYIHLLWGWKAALLFALFPLNVSGVAWTTGNYYMSTCLLVLATHFAVIHYSIYGILFGLFVWGYGALNSTLSSVPYLAIALLYPWGWTFIVSFVLFLFGKRLKTGLKRRREVHENIGVKAGKFHWKNIILMVKVFAYYVSLSIYPVSLGFFHAFGSDRGFFDRRTFLWSTLLIIIYIYWGAGLDITAVIWWFLFIGIFSQFVIFGQITAERYTYIANVAFCILVSKQLAGHDVLYGILATFYFCKCLEYIPAWRNNETLFNYSSSSFPEAPENYVNLASYYMDYDRWIDAARRLLIAEQLVGGRKHNTYVNLSKCFYALASAGINSLVNYKKAFEYTDKALADCPLDKVEALHNRRIDLSERIIKLNRKDKGWYK